MRIKEISVDNFKSLVDFTMALSHFNCLVGLNGAGKSTVLQFFDFLSQLFRGDLDNWLAARNWEARDLNSKISRKNNIDFKIVLETSDHQQLVWSASFNRQLLRCTVEKLVWNDLPVFSVQNGRFTEWREGEMVTELSTVLINYNGSLLSQLNESHLGEQSRQLKHFILNLHALDLLAPELLRQRTREAGNSLGLGGEKLSAFLSEIGENKRQILQSQLKAIYPHFQRVDISTMRSGWKKLTVTEGFKDSKIQTEARHVNDGFLRLLAIFAQLTKEQSFLLLDEIENGVNPEIIEFLVDNLVAAQPQVLVTSHSPMVLNYLEDDIAIKGVIYLYKKENGATGAVRLFDIPSMREKLKVMGPGEAYEDTMLTQLASEIDQLMADKA